MNKTTEPAALAGIEPVAEVLEGSSPRWIETVPWSERPISTKLYSAATVERLVQERDRLQTIDLDLQMAVQKLATMTQERDHWREANRTSLAAGDILKEQLAAMTKNKESDNVPCK